MKSFSLASIHSRDTGVTVTAFLQHELVHTAERRLVGLKTEKSTLLNWWCHLGGF